MKKKEFAMGILCGAMLFSGVTAAAAGITAEPTWQNIYVDGRQVSMTAYNIAGNNYVKSVRINRRLIRALLWLVAVDCLFEFLCNACFLFFGFSVRVFY